MSLLHKTQGIVCRLTPYRETSAIVNIFTSSFGLQSYIVNGVRSGSYKSSIAIYQPLTLLDLVVYYKQTAAVSRIKESRCSYIYRNLSGDFKKLSIALFINEILNKILREQNQASGLYNFLHTSMIVLDSLTQNIENFHLFFLIKLARFMGHGLHNTNTINEINILSRDEENKLQQLLNAEYTTVIPLTVQQRRSILNALLRFYSGYIHPLTSLNSLQVLYDLNH